MSKLNERTEEAREETREEAGHISLVFYVN